MRASWRSSSLSEGATHPSDQEELRVLTGGVESIHLGQDRDTAITASIDQTNQLRILDILATDAPYRRFCRSTLMRVRQRGDVEESLSLPLLDGAASCTSKQQRIHSRLGHVSGTFVGTSYLSKGPPTLKQSGKHTASNHIHRSRSNQTSPTLVPKHVWTSVSCSSVLSIMVVNHARCIANGS